jgi:hypothetical protein
MRKLRSLSPGDGFLMSADSLRTLLHCTRKETPQMKAQPELSQVRGRYVKGTSRGDNRMVSGLANLERTFFRVANLGYDQG